MWKQRKKFRAEDKIPKKGLTLPGYNYLGPFNDLNNGPPTNPTDAAAKRHDEAYDKLQKEGVNPYTTYNDADEAFIQEVENDIGGLIGKSVFKAKKAAAQLGIIPEHTTPQRPPRKRKKGISPNDKPTRKMPRLRDSDMVENQLINRRNPPPAAPPGDDDVDMESNVQSASRAATSTGRGTRHGETAVSNIPYSLRTPWPHTQQVTMRWRSRLTNASYSPTSVAQFQFRLNSIYDCFRNTNDTGGSEATATADTADATVNTPTWRNYWMNYYNYWTVVRSRYKCNIWLAEPNGGSIDNANRDVQGMVYVYHHGLQFPPALAATNTPVLHEHRVDHEGMYYFPITFTPQAKGTSFLQDMKTFTGDYTPGSIKHEVVEDELHQTWHKATEVPPTPEILNVIVQKAPVSDFGGTVSVRMEVEIEYDVQLKDLKQQFQYPTQATDISAINDYAAEAN